MSLTLFAIADYQCFVHPLAELSQQTDRGIVRAEARVELLRQQRHYGRSLMPGVRFFPFRELTPYTRSTCIVLNTCCPGDVVAHR